MQMQTVFPHINFRREVTIGHLILDVDAPTGNFAKVNPLSDLGKMLNTSGTAF
ncbi:MAG: hypothetical protein Ct9H300mP6_06550 [Gammaproteobacteria bacterium]|nr:MAG: hypothetical protein Ct9H300mP6_06550 [Gammaproteobacteria bacterium]